MQDIALAAFFAIEHELHGDARAILPLCMGRVAPVSPEIARIVSHHDPR